MSHVVEPEAKQPPIAHDKDQKVVLQDADDYSIKQADSTQRNLRPRHIQLIGIGGTIGTALFVNIGKGLLNGGPGSLFTAFTVWCMVILCVTNCMAEMVTYLPISSPFIRFAGRWVDDAFGVAAGYNFFVFEAALVPFEIVACSVIIKFWTDVIPVAAIITIVIVIYALINLFAVKWYGESEFWLALGKVLLIVGLLFYTFIAMLGGNPLHDRFGFRFWRDPGAFKPLPGYEGSRGIFMGWLQCLIQASFTIAGPDYVSMAAGEAENPRVVLPRAYKAVFYRLTNYLHARLTRSRHPRPGQRPRPQSSLHLRRPRRRRITIRRLHDPPAHPRTPAHRQRTSPHLRPLSREQLRLLRQPKSLRPRPRRQSAAHLPPLHPRRRAHLLRLGRPPHRPPGFLTSRPLLRRRAELVRQPRDGVATHQFRSHVLHLHHVPPRAQGAGHTPLVAAVSLLVPAVSRVVRRRRDDGHGLCGRIHGLPPWELGRADILVLIYHDLRLSRDISGMEVLEENESGQTEGGGSGRQSCRDRGL